MAKMKVLAIMLSSTVVLVASAELQLHYIKFEYLYYPYREKREKRVDQIWKSADRIVL